MTKKLRELFGEDQEFETAEDLAAKIENEGLDYFLVHYSGPEFWEGTKFEDLYNNYIDARESLLEALDEAGVEF